MCLEKMNYEMIIMIDFALYAKRHLYFIYYHFFYCVFSNMIRIIHFLTL